MILADTFKFTASATDAMLELRDLAVGKSISWRRKEGSNKKSPKRQKVLSPTFSTSTTPTIRDPLLGRVPSRFLALQKGEPLHSIKVIYARASKWHGAHAHLMIHSGDRMLGH